MKRTRKKHNAVIKAKGWWWRRSGGPDGAASVFEGGGGARACWERGVSKSVVLVTGGPMVRIHLPPVRSLLRT